MIKNECEIIKDLLPSYIEGTLNNATSEFIEKHNKECKDCKDILENLKMEQERQEAEINEKRKQDEIDYLKKYNMKLKILKIIAISLGISIAIIWGYLITTKVRKLY